MPNLLLDLPFELKIQVLEVLCEPWHLELKVIPIADLPFIPENSKTGNKCYRIIPSVTPDILATLRIRETCQPSLQVFDSRFRRLIKITGRSFNHGLAFAVDPFVQYSLDKTTTLRIGNWFDFEHVGPEVTKFLPALRVVEFEDDSDREFLRPDPAYRRREPGFLKRYKRLLDDIHDMSRTEIISTEKYDEWICERLLACRSRTEREHVPNFHLWYPSDLPRVDFHHHQPFRVRTPYGLQRFLVVVDLAEWPRILRKELLPSSDADFEWMYEHRRPLFEARPEDKSSIQCPAWSEDVLGTLKLSWRFHHVKNTWGDSTE